MLLFKRNLDGRLATLPRDPDEPAAPPRRRRGLWPFGRRP
jgi:hypothetical protein